MGPVKEHLIYAAPPEESPRAASETRTSSRADLPAATQAPRAHMDIILVDMVRATRGGEQLGD
jgi:hypothetical protein